MTDRQWDVSAASYQGYVQIDVKGGNKGVERIVPPAGEDYAYDLQKWSRRVSVTVSPTGRSVRVFVDGNEIR